MNISANKSNEPLKISIQLHIPNTSTAFPGVLNFGCTLATCGKNVFDSPIANTTRALARRFAFVPPNVDTTINPAIIAPPIFPITTDMASLATNGDFAISPIGNTYI